MAGASDSVGTRVLVFADEERGREGADVLARALDSLSLSLSLSLSPTSTLVAPAVECWPSTHDFVAAFERGSASTLVIDPAHAFRTVGALATLASLIRDTPSPLSRVVLYADSTESAMRGTCALASTVQCTLVVRGVDNPQLVSYVLRSPMAGLALRHTIEEVEARLRALPTLARQRCRQAMITPGDDSVKRIASDIGVSRRTMERWFADCGLPTPARLLKTIQLSAASDGQRTGPTIDREIDEPG